MFTTAGHAILRSTPLDGYDLPLRGTMQLGALGGVILLPALTTINLFSNCIFPSQQTEHAAPCTTFMKSIFELGKTTAFGAAAGAIGSALLGPRGYTILDLDHAARAGALGGAVIGPGEYQTSFMRVTDGIILLGMAIGLILIMMIIQWARPSREN